MELVIQSFMNHVLSLSDIAIYTILFIAAFLQMVIPPFPGETLLLVSGCLTVMGLHAHPLVTLFAYVTGTLFGSYVVFGLGYKYGNNLLKYKIVSKIFPRKNQRKIKRLILKYGVTIFFVCKFIPGFNVITILFGGIFKYSPIVAMVSITISSIIQNTLFFIIGRNIGYNIDEINAFLSNYNKVVWVILICGLIVYLVYKIRLQMIKCRK